MSYGARALTAYEAIWSSVVAARPDLAEIDYDKVWGVDPKHVWGRVEPAKLNLISLMKTLNWHPKAEFISGGARVGFRDSERHWRQVMDKISFEGLQEFAAWVIQDAPIVATENFIDPASLLVSMPAVQQHASAQWGTW